MPESWPRTRAGSWLQPLDSGNLFRSEAPLSGPIDTPQLSDRIQVGEETMPWGSCSPVDIQFQQVESSPLTCDFADTPECFFEHSWPHQRGQFNRSGGDWPWLPTLSKPEDRIIQDRVIQYRDRQESNFQDRNFQDRNIQETVPFGSSSFSA